MKKTKQSTPEFIFESSWEVCNKVGGIYTVLSTKAKTLHEKFGDNLIFIGPDLWKNRKNVCFKEDKTLLEVWRKTVEKEGFAVRVGRWDVPGNPIVVLVDYVALFVRKNDIYHRMWEKFGVNSLPGNGDYDDCCMFAVAVGKTIESLYHHLKLDSKRVVAQFHEWSLGMGVLYLKDRLPSVVTVFTTHATSVGRSICYNNKPLYSQFENYDGDLMARELNLEAKHSVEKQAARHADRFTTVSRLTARECCQLLGKEPDVITPNGFEPDIVPDEKTFRIKRRKARKNLIGVASCLTGEKIPADAFLVATAGRYEYKNKGVDVFIEALNRVRLVAPQRDILAFIFVPAGIEGVRADLKERIGSKKNNLTTPLHNPYYTHNLLDVESDPVCRYLFHLDFPNHGGRTKIVFVPSYLNGNDGVFELPYYDLLTGLDLTVFPSYYEPWGYTPLESIAFGIPTVTTDLTGFGQWARGEGISGDSLAEGVEVIARTDENYFEVAEKVKESIIAASEWNREQALRAASNARKIATRAEWKHFIRYYLQAYETK